MRKKFFESLIMRICSHSSTCFSSCRTSASDSSTYLSHKKNLCEVAARALATPVRTAITKARAGVVEKSNCVVAVRACVLEARTGVTAVFEN